MFRIRFFFVISLLLTFFISGEAAGATCLAGGCHRALTANKYLHGPIAAEEMGGKGCIACHVPAGKACTRNRGGVFKRMAPSVVMCQHCHGRGTGTQHSVKRIDCLKCHDPHGSNTSPQFKR